MIYPPCGSPPYANHNRAPVNKGYPFKDLIAQTPFQYLSYLFTCIYGLESSPIAPSNRAKLRGTGEDLPCPGFRSSSLYDAQRLRHLLQNLRRL